MSEKIYGILRGVVEDNDDPLESGRCRIRIHGIHTDKKEIDPYDSVPTDYLVWAQPCLPIWGGISKVGMYGIPCQGAHVFVFFENGNVQQPRYFATAPGIPRIPATKGEGEDESKYGFSDPDGIYPLETGGQPDWNKGDTSMDYLDAFVLEDKCGNRIVFDSTPGSEQIIIQNGGEKRSKVSLQQSTIRKQSGTGTDITQTGEREVRVKGDDTTIINGDYIRTNKNAKVSTIGDHTENISGPKDHSVAGIENRTSGGLAWNVKGQTTIMTGSEASFVSDMDTNIKSNTQSIKMEATLINIEMLALLGQIKSQSLSIDMLATTTAAFKGTITTNIGGGIITNVDGMMTTVNGSSVCMITGGVILIG
jgi:hypothetical protein